MPVTGNTATAAAVLRQSGCYAHLPVVHLRAAEALLFLAMI